MVATSPWALFADRRGWLREGGYQPDFEWWGPAAAIAGVGYVGLRISGAETGLLFLMAQAALFNAFCLTALMAGLGFFRRYVNRPTPVWNSLSRNAYSIYYLHPLILYPGAYAALSVQAPIFLEVAALTLFTVAVSWGLGALVLTRWPLLRDIF